MNRKKKIFDKLSKKAKKTNAKLNPGNKPRYISKAERARLELENQQQETPQSDEKEQSGPEY